MRFLDDHEIPTMQMIMEDLTHNPPGQGCFDMHLEFTSNAPFYIVYLMAELERAKLSKRQRRRRPDLQKQFVERIRKIQRVYLDSDEYKASRELAAATD